MFKMTFYTETTDPLGGRRKISIVIEKDRIKVTNIDSGGLIVERPVRGFENVLADLIGKCMVERHQDQQRLFHLEGVIADERKAGEEAVLTFVRNGRFLNEDAPSAKFAREVEAGWRSHGKADADAAAEAAVKAAVAKRIEDQPMAEEKADPMV